MSAQSARTTITVPLAVLRRVLDVHSRILENAAAMAAHRRDRADRVLTNDELHAYLERQVELDEEYDDLERAELEALRAYYVATAKSFGVDTAHPDDQAARLESTIRLAAGGER